VALAACDAAGPPAEEPLEEEAPAFANVYVPPEGCSGPDEHRILEWSGTLLAVRPGCVRVPAEALASLRAACAKTPTEPVWVAGRPRGAAETNPCK
jgi:hypothetical protein